MIGLDVLLPAIGLCVMVWAFDNFFLARQRIVKATAQVAAGNHDIKALLAESNISQGCRFAFYALVVAIIFASIRESADLQLMILASVVVLVVFWLLDIVILRKPRKTLIHASGNQKTQDLAKADVMLVTYAKGYTPLLALVFVMRAFIAEPFQIPSASMKPTLIEGDFVVVSKFGYGLRVPGLETELFDLGDPNPGDVIVFKPPHELNRTYIKRLVAVPGDHVRYDFVTKSLYLNHVLVPETEIGREVVDGQTVVRYQSTINGVEFELFKSLNETGYSLQELEYGIADNLANAPGYRTSEAFQLHKQQLNIAKGFVVPQGEYFAMGDNRDNSQDSRFWGTLAEEKIQGRAMALWLHWPKLTSIPSFKNNKVLAGADNESN